MFKARRSIAALTLAAICVTSAVFAPEAEAAKKTTLSRNKVTLEVKQSAKIKIKNVKAAKVKKLTVKSSKKKVAAVKKNGKTAFTITGKKAGKAVVTVKIKVGAKTTTKKVKVTVAASKEEATATPQATSSASAAQSTTPATILPSATPATLQPMGTPGAASTEEPSVTAMPGSSFVPVTYKKSSFENGTDGFTGRAGQESVSVADNGYEGKCLYVTGRKATWHGAKIDVASTIVAGATYKVTAWMKHTANTAVEIKCSGQVGETYPAIASVKDAEPNVWTKLEGIVEMPAVITDYIIYFEVPGSQNADFYLDNVVITQISEAKEPEVLTSIKDTYQDIFPYMGTCINYDGWRAGKQLQTASTVEFVKKHFNSISLEDEMKPSSVMGNFVTELTLEQAVEKGYVIPENYPEESVPQLNFDTLDRVLEICQEEGLKLRAHTLQWHQQTPVWFFGEDYGTSEATTPEIMDARLEFYVRTVMKHVMDKEKELTGSNGSIIYCWDVTNEYLHRTNDPTSLSWVDVYGDQGLEPTYVKKAFQLAYDMLKQYQVEDAVVLFYNDYNTYFETEDLISLVNYINEGEEKNICGGIGMQTHIDVKRPSIEQYKSALEEFLATGLEVQITELDVTINYDNLSTDLTNEDQAAFMKDFMEMVVLTQKNRDTSVSPKGITGVTIWGLYDSVSWRGSYGPLLFGSSIVDPKPSFYAFIEAADVWKN